MVVAPSMSGLTPGHPSVTGQNQFRHPQATPPATTRTISATTNSFGNDRVIDEVVGGIAAWSAMVTSMDSCIYTSQSVAQSGSPCKHDASQPVDASLIWTTRSCLDDEGRTSRHVGGDTMWQIMSSVCSQTVHLLLGQEPMAQAKAI